MPCNCLQTKDPFLLMSIINKKMRANFDHMLGKYGLTAQQGRILFFINRANTLNKQNVKQVDIEREFSLSKANVSVLIKRLESSGFITRHKVGNSYYIEDTEKARQIIRFIDENKSKIEQKIVKGLNKEDIDRLIDNLRIMLENIIEEKEE